MNSKGNVKQSVQGFGRFLSGMVLPNIGAFIAWGLITALFIETGWLPNERLANLVGPMLTYLIPLLIAYTGGKTIGGLRGGVIGSIAAMGVIIGADVTMILGAMIVGPLAGWIIKKVDDFLEDKIPAGFEMLINNFSLGIIGAILAILGYLVIGPAFQLILNVLSAGVQAVVNAHLLPLISIFIEPAKILFLNNAINHGILGPLGAEQVKEAGKSIFYLLEANPGPGLGVLLAYFFFSKGSAKESSTGAMIIHFFGGIHEIYFPYVLMNPMLILACIAGGISGVLTFTILGAGLVAPPSPGSIIALITMSPPGDIIKVLLGVVVSTVVSFLVAAIFVKRATAKMTDEDLKKAKEKVTSMKKESKGQPQANLTNITSIIYACDAGMGSSAMGASMLKKRLSGKGININVKNYAINDIPKDASIVVTHEQLTQRARSVVPNAYHISVTDFLDMSVADEVEQLLKNSGNKVIADDSANTGVGKDLLKKESILIAQKNDSREVAVRKAGELLVKGNYVEASYVDAMIQRERDISTYIGKGIAMPHGVEAAKKSIKKSGISIVLYPDGIEYDDAKAYIIVGIAGKENEHLGIIAKIAEILDEKSEDEIKQIAKSADASYIMNLFK